MSRALRALTLLAFCLPAFAAPPKTPAQPPQEMYDYPAVQGDTLTGISTRFLQNGNAWQQLLKYNKIANPDHINPGEIVHMPLEWVKRDPVTLSALTSRGDVQVVRNGTSTPLPVGATLAKGDEVRTGADGYVTLRLADGSVLKLPADSRLTVQNAEKIRDTEAVRSKMQLLKGRVEAVVTKFKGSGNRFEVTTEQAVAGVRGTEFRVATEGGSTASEVLDGRVAFDGEGAAAGKSALLAAGFGSKVLSSGDLLPPVQLLPAPVLGTLPVQERLVVRFTFTAIDGAQKYRAQVGRDAQFFDVVADTVVEAPNLRFAGLEDGPYFLRVRGIDSNGLEGRDAVYPFSVKARPEPPLVSAPVDRNKVRAAPVEFAWATIDGGAKYRMQVARDAAFSDIVFEASDIADTKITAPAGLPLGDYYWRIRTLLGNDIGPWSDVRSFHLLPPPALPEPPQLDGNRIKFSWGGEPGQTFVFQVSRDPKFGKLEFEDKLTAPVLDKPKPRPGSYYMRYRAIDADGFEGPFTAPQRFTIDPPKIGNPWPSQRFRADAVQRK
ncbi:MAG: LysM peptidoglycan-binding protein [Betaproteobacteria bacterium]|nr:LysM peptidoglycan-binding protein [Betaproteobacteria bacterium]